MNAVTYSTKCVHMIKPYFKVEIDVKGNEKFSLIILEESFIVNSFYIDRNYYVFTLRQVSKTIIIDGAIKGTYIEDNGIHIHILSLPFLLLRKFGCMK